MSESQAKIFAYVKTKMLLVLGKNTLEMNKVTENECLPNFELKFKLLENLRKPFTLKKYEIWVSLSDLVALAMRFKINPQPDDINSFMKCNMEFSHQAANLTIVLIQWLIMWLQSALLVEAPWPHG